MTNALQNPSQYIFQLEYIARNLICIKHTRRLGGTSGGSWRWYLWCRDTVAAHTSPFGLKAEVRVAQYPAEAAVRR